MSSLILLRGSALCDDEIVVPGASFSACMTDASGDGVEVSYGKLHAGFRRYQVRRMIEETLTSDGDERRPLSLTETRDDEGYKTFIVEFEP